MSLPRLCKSLAFFNNDGTTKAKEISAKKGVVSASQVNKEKGGLSSRSIASQLYIHKSKPTFHQKKIIEALYEEGHGFNKVYCCLNREDQVNMAALLALLGLDTDTWESVANRWHVCWTNGERNDTSRVLYQW